MDEPVPRSDGLDDLVERLSAHNQEEREKLDATLDDIDNIDDLSPQEAYELGRLKGAEAATRKVRSTINEDVTGIYFETRDELADALTERYSSHVVLTEIEPSLDSGSPTVYLGYSWVELPDRLSDASAATLAEEVEIVQVDTDSDETEYKVSDIPDDAVRHVAPNLIQQTAIKFGSGFVVDFGPASSLRLRLKRAAEDAVGRSISP